MQPEVAQQTQESGKLEVHGSLRDRTVQSSALRALAEQFKDVSFETASYQEVLEWLKEGGLEEFRNLKLDFAEGDGEFRDKMYEAFKSGKILDWMIQESDQQALEAKQDPDNVSTYSSLAANVATYLLEQGMNHSEANKTIFATSHQTILESFLHKALIKIGEKERAEELLAEHLNGFAENQGFKVDFKLRDTEGEDFEVVIVFADEEYVLSKSQFMEIIGEGVELYGKLKKGFKK